MEINHKNSYRDLHIKYICFNFKWSLSFYTFSKNNFLYYNLLLA